jgi:hypothetical protein
MEFQIEAAPGDRKEIRRLSACIHSANLHFEMDALSVRLAIVRRQVLETRALSLQAGRQYGTILVGGASAAFAHNACELAIDYSGAISWKSMVEIGRKLALERARSRWTIERFFKAATMFGPTVMVRDMQSMPDWAPPSAVLVRPDQLAIQNAYSALLLKSGIHRACFLPEMETQARDWLASYQC